MAELTGLLHDAKRLTTRARVKRDNAAGVQADGQFSTALSKLTTQFPDLRSQLANRTALAAEGIPIGPTPDLVKSAERLREQIVQYGRPTPQFVNSRSADLVALIKELRALNDEAWKRWASAQVTALAVEPDLLHGPRGQAVQDKLASIMQIASRAFNRADLTFFKFDVDQVREMIGDLREPMSPEEVIERIEAARGTLSLDDLNDEEIAVLRNSPGFGHRVRLSLK